jgi:hypothetical protein
LKIRPAWFEWLETATTFRYFSGQRRNVYNGNGPLFAPVSFRKEQRRQGYLWYVYRLRVSRFAQTVRGVSRPG